MSTPIRNTINHLKRCIAARKAGYDASCTTDAAWLVNMAINRRAGWPDDPSTLRGSAMPVNGTYPKNASGDFFRHLRLIAHEVNTPRLIVRVERLGECRDYLLKRLPKRFLRRDEE